MHDDGDRDEGPTGTRGAGVPSADRAGAEDLRGTASPLVDAGDLRRREREWYAARDETAPRPREVPRVPTAPWQLPPHEDDRSDEVEDGDDEDPKLRRSRRVVVFGGVLALWALVMLAFDVHWWNFDDHGPWLTPLTPLLLGGAVEQALLRRWPEWARDHDPALLPDRRRGAEALGERARPYWARESAGGIERGTTSGAIGSATSADVPGATSTAGGPGERASAADVEDGGPGSDLSARTAPSP